MWLGAFSAPSITSPVGVVSLSLALVAMFLAALAFVKETAPQYELDGNRSGAGFAALGILLYLAGTTLQSGFLHAFSITVFYWGAVLYLGGKRAVIPVIPSGLIIASLFVPSVSGLWGAVYLAGLSWALVVTSVAILWIRRGTRPPKGCSLCDSFRGRGKAYCSSCGRFFRTPTPSLPRRRFVGFAVFAVAMLVLLSLTVPVASATPSAGLSSFGLGGSRSDGGFPQLPGWEVTGLTPAGSGTGASQYLLTSGGASVMALLAVSQDSQAAFSMINATMNNPVPYPKIPATVSQSMSGYSFTKGGTRYVGLLGVFPIGLLNGSQLVDSFVAVELSQEAGSFARDNGTAVYSAATSVVGWVSSWGEWSTVVGAVQSSYQTFSDIVYACSLSVLGVVLFTVARDNELEKVRRVESIRGLGDTEFSILRAFGATPIPLRGEDLLTSSRSVEPTLSILTFFSSLEELARRGLVSPTLVLRGGTPTLFWKCLV